MSIITLIAILALLAGAAWAVNRYFTGAIRTITHVVLVVLAIIVCLIAFGIWGDLKGVQVPRL